MGRALERVFGSISHVARQPPSRNTTHLLFVSRLLQGPRRVPGRPASVVLISSRAMAEGGRSAASGVALLP